MKKNQGIITAIPFVLSIACFTAKMLSNEYIDANGILHEKFFLIPLAYMFLLIGVIMLVWNVARNIKQNSK